MNWFLCNTLLVMLLAIFPTMATATEVALSGTDLTTLPELAEVPAAAAQERRPQLKAQASAEQVGRSGIAGSPASFAFTEYSAGLEYLFLLLDVDHRDYEWRAGAALPGAAHGLPWQSLTRLAPGVQYYRQLGEWGIWAKLVGLAGFEDSISSRSWTYNPQLLGTYSPSSSFTYYGGLGMLHHRVEPVFYPVLGVAWNMDSARGLGAAVGFPETMLRFRYNEALAVKFDFQWDLRTYSLAADNPLAARGYLQIEDRIPGLALEFTPLSGLTLTPGVRWYLGRSLTVFDRDGIEQPSLKPDSVWAASFRVSYLFP